MSAMVVTQDEPGVLLGSDFVPSTVLERRAAQAASGLRSLGVGPGDSVGLLLRNDHAFFEASLAAAIVGASPVPINWHGSGAETEYVLKDCGAKALVAHADLLRSVSEAIPTDVTVLGVATPWEVAEAYAVPAAEARLPVGTTGWAEWLEGFEPFAADQGPAPVAMIYTSGTTGKPKGVRRLAIQADARQTQSYMADTFRVLGVQPGLRTVITGPMYHGAPNGYALASFKQRGFVVLQTRFDAEELLRMIEIHRITAVHLVPTMFVRLLRLDPAVRARYDLSSLTHVVHAAAPCPPEVKRAMIDWLGPIVFEYYGGTETGVVTGCDSKEWLEHPGTVGRPLISCSVRIYADDGSRLPQGAVGEVFARAGGWPDFTYEGREQDRSEAERDGLITCGDVGFLDADGFLHLCDRKRDMIISGGVNIYPAEIEACLLTHPAVRDCAVFGIPDEEFGEAVAAAVELEPGATLSADAVQEHVKSGLAAFKAPRLVEFHDALPREDSGKVLKRKLRAPHWEAAGRAI